MLPIHTILCPLDFSNSSYKALRNAAELATHFNAELFLVHVLAPIPILATPSSVVPTVMPVEPPDVGQSKPEEQELAAEERLNAAAKPLLPVGSRIKVEIGNPADEIVRLAKSESVDLIVISTHGVTGWRHLIFGSVAEKVIRLADRPVLVIPAHEAE